MGSHSAKQHDGGDASASDSADVPVHGIEDDAKKQHQVGQEEVIKHHPSDS